MFMEQKQILQVFFQKILAMLRHCKFMETDFPNILCSSLRNIFFEMIFWETWQRAVWKKRRNQTYINSLMLFWSYDD